MYGRAIKKLKSLLNHKGYKDSAMDNQSFGLYHFHIEANEDSV